MEYPAAGATTMGGEDHEEDDEYEDVFVVLELPDLPDAFLEDCKTYQLIGIDTETPMLRLGSSVFKGSFQDVLGTNLIFSEHPSLKALPGSRRIPAASDATLAPSSAADDDAQGRGQSAFELAVRTSQRIRFEPAVVERRQPPVPPAGAAGGPL
jgi:hypothetical protein